MLNFFLKIFGNNSQTLTTIGFPEMCEQNEEAFAYLLQWTVNRIAELGR
jgi:hypothetical protein